MEPPVIRSAQPEDRAHVEALLIAAGLPTEGVAEHFGSFFVVDDGGRVVGAAGVELYGESALLRSVVVTGDLKGRGWGSTLTRRALGEAQARGARVAYLLTTTADGFFPRFGFERITRGEVPPAVACSCEFQGACPATAIAMRASICRPA
jgi:amino-acid N-acetyltransferase